MHHLVNLIHPANKRSQVCRIYSRMSIITAHPEIYKDTIHNVILFKMPDTSKLIR